MTIYELETPCIIIDEKIMKQNITRQAELMKKAGVNFRPHTKTHKTPEIAHLQMAAGAIGINCAKLAEAEVMADGGLKDIFVAYSLIGESKIKRAIALSKRIRLIVAVDSVVGAKMMSDVLSKTGDTLEVRMEVDLGAKRTGVPQKDAVEAAKYINSLKGINLTGLYGYKSLNYKGSFSWDAEKAGVEEGEILTSVANEMRKAGVNIKDVSVGSSPTGVFAATVPGVTEIRAGTYIFGDTKMMKCGVSRLEDCAARVLYTVVSRPYPDLMILDGGNKAISTDTAPGGNIGLVGFGLVANDPNLVMDRLNEEHGIVRAEKGEIAQKIGDRVTVIPNHICTTMNLYDKFYFVDGEKVLREVTIAGRGKSY